MVKSAKTAFSGNTVANDFAAGALRSWRNDGPYMQSLSQIYATILVF